MKYVFTTTSANFGNMVSMAGAAALLPFLPLLPAQILLINSLTDLPATTIATDEVDPEQLDMPHSWDIGFVQSFMIVFGLVSSAFDFLTFGVLRLGFGADATLFRSGLFLESVVTELAVLLVLRTRRPFFRSWPSRLLAASSLGLLVVMLLVLYGPLGSVIGLEPLSPAILGALAVITVGYVAATEVAKWAFYRTRVVRRSADASTGRTRRSPRPSLTASEDAIADLRRQDPGGQATSLDSQANPLVRMTLYGVIV